MDRPQVSGNSISIPPNLSFLTAVDDFVESFLERCGAEQSVIADIAISVSELVNNAVAHGSRSAVNRPVVVSISRSDNVITVTVSDPGAGFNPNNIDDPLSDENLLKETGRGIFIVRSLMDTVAVNVTPEGTTVTITKAI
ncbi:MAG TPA: ATP-binding protein [Candidatus Deferrimicrobium sp.]|nr:ATP-binding protein [Candidatus Deferrimicrobium sp.]